MAKKTNKAKSNPNRTRTGATRTIYCNVVIYTYDGFTEACRFTVDGAPHTISRRERAHLLAFGVDKSGIDRRDVHGAEVFVFNTIAEAHAHYEEVVVPEMRGDARYYCCLIVDVQGEGPNVYYVPVSMTSEAPHPAMSVSFVAWLLVRLGIDPCDIVEHNGHAHCEVFVYASEAERDSKATKDIARVADAWGYAPSPTRLLN